MEDVINNIKEAFLDDGVDEQVLLELKQVSLAYTAIRNYTNTIYLSYYTVNHVMIASHYVHVGTKMHIFINESAKSLKHLFFKKHQQGLMGILKKTHGLDLFL